MNMGLQWQGGQYAMLCEFVSVGLCVVSTLIHQWNIFIDLSLESRERTQLIHTNIRFFTSKHTILHTLNVFKVYNEHKSNQNEEVKHCHRVNSVCELVYRWRWQAVCIMRWRRCCCYCGVIMAFV